MKAIPMSTIDTTSSRTLMNTANNIHLTRLLQFTDSTCPIGAFTFSCGLESAVANGIVHNSDTLKEYVRANAVQAAYCDAIAAIHAHRAAAEDNYGMILQADKELLMVKMNDESRSMLRKMGRKFAELFNSITPTPVSMQLIDSIRNNDTPGCYPTVQGVCFASISIATLANSKLGPIPAVTVSPVFSLTRFIISLLYLRSFKNLTAISSLAL